MLKSHLMTLLALSCATFMLLIVWLIRFFQDDLFFHSDLLSLWTILSALALLPTLGVAVVLTPFLVRHRWSSPLARLRRCAESLFLVWLLSCAVWFGLELVVLRNLAAHAKKVWPPAIFEAMVLGGLLAAFYVFLRRSRRRDDMLRRSTAAARGIFVAAVAATLWSSLSGILARHATGKAEKHFVLVVLDKCPSQCFHTFNPRARARADDSVHTGGRVYTNVHASFPYTWSAFGTLYNGTTRNLAHPSVLAGQPQKSQPSRKDLLTLLQAAGVRTRILTDHRNATPEGSALQVTHCRGLRSSLLKPFMRPLLDALNLDCIYVYNNPYPLRLELLLRVLPKALAARLRVQEPAERFRSILLPEMESIRKEGARSFLVFHTDWQKWKRWWPAWHRHDIASRMKERDNRYTPEEAWYAELTAAQLDVDADHLLSRMKEFLREMANRGLMSHTIVLFTSDHGTMAGDGRMWYEYHPQEDVLRIETVAYGDVQPGVDSRLLSTPDITQTILDYFGVKERLDSEACSLLSDRERSFTASLTLQGDINKELFLVIYKERMKYLFNLHPRGKGECVLQRFGDPFNPETVVDGPSVLTAAAPEVVQALADFGVAHETTKEVHPLFTREHLSQILPGGGLSKCPADQGVRTR